MYVELHARSAFSFLEGASLPELLMARALNSRCRRWRCLTATVSTGRRAFTSAQRAGTRAHIGAEIAVRDAGERVRPPEWLPMRCSGARALCLAGGIQHWISEPLPADHSLQAARRHESGRRGAAGRCRRARRRLGLPDRRRRRPAGGGPCAWRIRRGLA